MNPKVTIGICVKNCENFIEECIISVLNQDFSHELIEIVVVDGYSKDNTIAILRQVLKNADIKNKVFYENEGLGSARQIVVDNSKGRYIVWVDGDMTISRDYVTKLFEFMEQNSEVGITKGKQALDPGGNLLATLETYSRAISRMVDYNLENAQSKSMGTAGAIYRVNAIKQVGGFDKKITGYGEDTDAEYRVRRAGWMLCTIDVQYRDYERVGILWKDLWFRYFKRGSDARRLSRIGKLMINFYKMLPPAGFVVGIIHSIKIYRLTNRKVAFLLPLQYVFKMTAWCVGFIRE